MMSAINAQQLQGQWNQLKGRVKERWGQLTDDDLQWAGGNVDQLVGRIQQKTGEGREAIESYLRELTERGSSTFAQATESARTYAQQTAERFRDRYEDLADEARYRYEEAEGLVRHYPGQSVAMAFGIGLVAGIFVGLALRSR